MLLGQVWTAAAKNKPCDKVVYAFGRILTLCRTASRSWKAFLSIFALTLALAFTVPAFAGPAAETKEQCHNDGGYWDAKTKHCSGKYYR
jgi:hypothetical protein